MRAAQLRNDDEHVTNAGQNGHQQQQEQRKRSVGHNVQEEGNAREHEEDGSKKFCGAPQSRARQ